jgi:hypothetical protein
VVARGGDVTQHLVQTGRQDGFQMVGCFALGVTQFYKVIFSECSRQNTKDFFHQKVMLRTDLVCTVKYIGQSYSQYEMEFIMNSIVVRMSKKIFSGLQKK